MVDLKKTLTVLTAAKAAIARPLSPSNSDIGESELSTTDDFGSESLMGQFNMTVDGDTGPSLYLQVDEDTAEELEERYDFLFKREPKGGGGGGGRGGGGKSSGGKSGGGKSGDGKSSGIGGKSKSGPDTRTGEPVKGPIPEVFTREGSSLYAGGGPYHKRSSSASKKGNSTIVVVDLTELPKGMEYGFQVSSTGSLPNQEEADKMAVLGSNVIISGTGDENSTFDRDLFVRYPNNTIQGVSRFSVVPVGMRSKRPSSLFCLRSFLESMSSRKS